MTAKEYLRKLSAMRRQIRSVENQLNALYMAATGLAAIRYDKEKVQTSPDDYLLLHMVEIEETEQTYKEMLFKYHKAMQEIMVMIDGLDDTVYVQILTLRYCDGLSFEKISCELGYTYRHTTRLHGQALQAFAEKYHDKLTCP